MALVSKVRRDGRVAEGDIFILAVKILTALCKDCDIYPHVSWGSEYNSTNPEPEDSFKWETTALFGQISDSVSE